MTKTKCGGGAIESASKSKSKPISFTSLFSCSILTNKRFDICEKPTDKQLGWNYFILAPPAPAIHLAGSTHLIETSVDRLMFPDPKRFDF